MEGHRGLLLALIVNIFSILHLAHCQNPEGFLSLDCGLPTKESPYTEKQTRLVFFSDADFISSGKSGKVKKDDIGDYMPYKVLRYFPEGVRNCYNIRVNQGTKYLIRAGFVYGNYDGLNVVPRFDLYIGPYIWTVVDSSDNQEEEIIHITNSSSLQICLVKTGPTTPFISSLELRPLRNDIYISPSGSLKLIVRLGANTLSYTRYPDDVFDRSWHIFVVAGTIAMTTAPNVTSNQYELPEVIITSGATPLNTSESLPIYYGVNSYGVNNNDPVVYLYLHFAETRTLKANDTREFDIIWPGNIPVQTYRPKTFQTETLFKALPNECESESCVVELVRTGRSTLPPLLNAYEIYTIIEFPFPETYSDDVVAIKNIEAAYRLNIISWQGDPCLPQVYKWAYIECNYSNNSIPPRIISLDLSDRGLKGIIAPAFQNLTQLQKLDLSSNSLTGEIPEFLANMKSLSTINLSWNNLKGLIPQALRNKEKNGLKLNIQGNKKLCLDGKCKSSKPKFLVPVVASIAAMLLIVVVLLLFLVYKKKKVSKVRHRSPITKSEILTKKRRFTYSEVEAVTNNFERVIGEGGFGIVYHGHLNDTEQVAVKVLSHSSTQGYKQFKAEVELLLRVHHTNLVNLVGYCNEEDHLALVYEYASNGDLKQHLSGESGSAALNWTSRIGIATETAQGLEYLHIGCEPPMIHRDVKTTNILLDEHFHAKLADFGLSRSFPVGVESHVSTNVAGTPGYLDPEYYRTNWLTEKSDVYSMGIVLLEIITNQPVIQQVREKPHIAEWVGLMLTKGDIKSIMDPNLNGDYDSSSVWKALELAMSCVNPSSTGRPNMSQVVSELKECLIYENSKKEGRSDMDSKSSIELSTSFTAEVTPDAR